MLCPRPSKGPTGVPGQKYPSGSQPSTNSLWECIPKVDPHETQRLRLPECELTSKMTKHPRMWLTTDLARTAKVRILKDRQLNNSFQTLANRQLRTERKETNEIRPYTNFLSVGNFWNTELGKGTETATSRFTELRKRHRSLGRSRGLEFAGQNSRGEEVMQRKGF